MGIFRNPMLNHQIRPVGIEGWFLGIKKGGTFDGEFGLFLGGEGANLDAGGEMGMGVS